MADPHIINIDQAEEEVSGLDREHWGHTYKALTPAMGQGRLGANLTRLPPGRAAVPFHAHQLEDEIFYILEGRGVFRYGDTLHDVRPGDCIACPAGTGKAHQMANPFDEDLLYLAIGRNDPNEVAYYPDTGKILIRGLQRIGYLESTEYMDGEPERPRVFDLIDQRASRGRDT